MQFLQDVLDLGQRVVFALAQAEAQNAVRADVALCGAHDSCLSRSVPALRRGAGVSKSLMGIPRTGPSAMPPQTTGTVWRPHVKVSTPIVSGWPTVRSEPPGATSQHIANGHVNGRLPWAYSRPRAVISARVRMEPKSSGILGMFRRSLFNLRARSKAPRLEISRNSCTS